MYLHVCLFIHFTFSLFDNFEMRGTKFLIIHHSFFTFVFEYAWIYLIHLYSFLMKSSLMPGRWVNSCH